MNNKFGWLLLLTVLVWQVTLTGSEKMTLACGFGLPQPCKVADSARRTVYLVSGALGIAILLKRKN